MEDWVGEFVNLTRKSWEACDFPSCMVWPRNSTNIIIEPTYWGERGCKAWLRRPIWVCLGRRVVLCCYYCCCCCCLNLKVKIKIIIINKIMAEISTTVHISWILNEMRLYSQVKVHQILICESLLGRLTLSQQKCGQKHFKRSKSGHQFRLC